MRKTPLRARDEFRINFLRCISGGYMCSGDQAIDDLAGYVCQPVTTPLVFKCQFFVIEAHEVEDGGVEVMDVDGVLDDIVAEVIRLSIDSGLDAAPGHPEGEASGVMVTSIVFRR